MIYKVRVILDAKETIFRDIEIKEKQTLWNLHLAIKSAFNLKDEEMSSFYFSDDEWTQHRDIPLEDMSEDGDGDTMADIYVSEAFSQVGDKMLYKYGFIDLWEFFLELLEINEEKAGLNYPLTAYRFGTVPLKAPVKSVSSKSHASDLMDPMMMEDDFLEDGYNDEDLDEFSAHVDEDDSEDGYDSYDEPYQD